MRPRSRVLGMLALLLLGIPASGSARAATEYIQTSDIHGDEIVFMAEGDLWLASTSGGTPQRLTTHVGSEYFPAFSPDGKQIAFTGSYDGNSDVFVIPTTGGEPQRLTWHPGSDQVVGWWPDGSKVIFRSSRSDPNHTSHLFTVDLKGGDPVELPLGWAARIDVDPKTGMYAFDRSTREWATWKRYRGGTASNLWVGDPNKSDYKQITNFAGMDLFPMWHDGLIYFLSDQGGTANIWSIKPDGTDRKRHTDFGKWDARWPAMGPDGRIVFTLAGDLHIFDPATDKTQKVELNLPSDRKLT
ncbi:MAG TPA: peptidase S41, partial [Candidatus Krumholzibacteria bacterium]|nr:peptidase S41 [Candidatus Krumholzibacteria bacterium]